jgi:RNA polymerase sigma-70 factor (ECF subfamily)
VEPWSGPGSFDELLARVRAGDDAAFAQLWRWMHPALLRWQAVVARDAGEDLVSEVWISAIRGLDNFRGGDREFIAWCFTIARRRAIDAARRRMRQPLVVNLEEIDRPALDPSGDLGGDDAVATAIALLRQLRPAQAEVVALRIIADLSVSQTAAVVGRTDRAVRILCHRGLRTLATLVDYQLAARA